MSESFLQQKIQCLLDCMENHSYSSTAIGCYQRHFRWAEEYCLLNNKRVPALSDANTFISSTTKLHPKEDPLLLRRSWYLLSDFFETGEFHLQRYCYREAQLCGEFLRELEVFTSEMKNSGLAAGSISILACGVRNFLDFLEKKDCHSISGIRHSHLNDFLMSNAPKYQWNISNMMWPLNKFFSHLQKQGRLPFDQVPRMPHPVARRKKVLPCMEDSETSAILAAIDTDTSMGKRDYAIIITAAYTGMRISDIFALELSSIRWTEKKIVFTQKKTGRENVVPLSAEVGNAIARYILEGRPRSDSQRIFLSSKAPYQPMGASGNRTRLMHVYQKKAGIDREAYDGKGFHAFRRAMGTKMSEAGVPVTMVSQALGHSSPVSAKRYISLDTENLRECCLDINAYHTTKEGLS